MTTTPVDIPDLLDDRLRLAWAYLLAGDTDEAAHALVCTGCEAS